MNTNELLRFQITVNTNGHFILTGAKGATYVATPAFIGDNDTMKFVGGLRGYGILRNRKGEEFRVSRHALAEFAVVAA